MEISLQIPNGYVIVSSHDSRRGYCSDVLCTSLNYGERGHDYGIDKVSGKRCAVGSYIHYMFYGLSEGWVKTFNSYDDALSFVDRLLDYNPSNILFGGKTRDSFEIISLSDYVHEFINNKGYIPRNIESILVKS